MSKTNEQAVIGLNEARAAALVGAPRDWSEVRGFFADKFVEYGAWNINSVDDFIARVTEAWEKLQMQVKLEEIMSADNRVFARWTLTGIRRRTPSDSPRQGRSSNGSPWRSTTSTRRARLRRCGILRT